MSDIVPMPQSREMFSVQDMYWTSLDTNAFADKKTILRCLSDTDETIKGSVNKQILVQHIFAHMVELTNEETGEISKAPRIVLIDPEGTTYSCVSEGVYRDISALIWLYGKPPFDPPLKVEPKLIQLKGGRNMLKLELIDEDRPNKKKRIS